jgi:UDP-glucose 4-epimerase
MSNILITGGRGFLGTNLVPLLSKKHEIVVYDLTDGLDIFDDQVEKLIKNTDIVIHLAALTSVGESFINPGETFKTNVLGSARIARLCIKYKKKLIYPSSAAVIHPELSPYANTKWVAEQVIKGVMGETNIVILRFVNMFGPHMNSRSGSMMYNFLHSDNIVVFGDGEQTRDFIHVRDTTQIIQDALKSKWNGKIVDIGTGQPYSTNYVAGLFAHYRGKKISYKPPKREMRWHAIDTSVLMSIYKKKLTTNLEKDIKELCQNL